MTLDPAARRLRRHGHGEPLRRHPVGRGQRAGRARWGCCRRRRSASGGPPTACTACTSRSTAPRRTSPARTSPTRSATILSGGDDAALVAGPGRRRRGDRAGGRRRRWTTATARRTCVAADGRRSRASSTVGTQAMADAVVAALEATRPARPRPSARGPARRRQPPDDRPRGPLRHDPARRHPARGPDRLARRQDQDRPPARRVRHGLHRGRLAGLQPQGRRLLRGRPVDRLEEREAGRLRLDPPPLQPRRDRPQPASRSSPPRRRS